MNIFEKIDLIKKNLDCFTTEDKQNIISILDKYLNVNSNIVLESDTLIPFPKKSIALAKHHLKRKILERFLNEINIEKYKKYVRYLTFYTEVKNNNWQRLNKRIYIYIEERLEPIHEYMSVFEELIEKHIDKKGYPNWLLNSYISINTNPKYKDVNYKIKETQKNLLIDEYYNIVFSNETNNLVKKLSLL